MAYLRLQHKEKEEAQKARDAAEAQYENAIRIIESIQAKPAAKQKDKKKRFFGWS